MTLGENLQKLRKAKGLSQDEVAQKLYLSRQSVSKWENGQAEPGVENLKKLSRLYGVTVDVLIGAEEPQTEELPPAPLDSAYRLLMKYRLAAVAAIILLMLVADDHFYFLLLLSECLVPGAFAMLLGYWTKKKWAWVLLMATECFFVLIISLLFGTNAPFMGFMAFLLGCCWIFRLCQTDIQRLFFKEDDIP